MVYRNISGILCALLLASGAWAADLSRGDQNSGQNDSDFSKSEADCNKSMSRLNELTGEIRALNDPQKGALDDIQRRFALIKHVAVACGSDRIKSENASCQKNLDKVSNRVDEIGKVIGTAKNSRNIEDKNRAIEQSKLAANEIDNLLKQCNVATKR